MISNKPVVLVDPHFRKMNEIFSAADLARLNDLVEVVWGRDEPMPLQAAREALAQAVAVVCANWRYEDALYHAPHLRAILTVSGGFPLEFDYDYCFANKILVSTAAPAFARSVAEMALGMALDCCREIAAGDRALRAGREQWLHAGNANTFMLYDKPVGFIGFGSLAQALRPLLQPFGCPISVYDPWLGPGYLRSQGVEPVEEVGQLLEQSRVIFVLAVPSVENRALLSRQLLERIQPGAVLVLISRAHVVDFDALTELVTAGRFKAAIDVFPNEPLAPDHPIRQAEHALLSAHRAGSVKEGLWEIGQMVVDDLEMIIRDLPPRRMQVALPQLVNRYSTNRVSSYRDRRK
jgi:phosphoglycerate dehydrogenase-like enzyme